MSVQLARMHGETVLGVSPVIESTTKPFWEGWRVTAVILGKSTLLRLSSKALHVTQRMQLSGLLSKGESWPVGLQGRALSP